MRRLRRAAAGAPGAPTPQQPAVQPPTQPLALQPAAQPPAQPLARQPARQPRQPAALQPTALALQLAVQPPAQPLAVQPAAQLAVQPPAQPLALQPAAQLAVQPPAQPLALQPAVAQPPVQLLAFQPPAQPLALQPPALALQEGLPDNMSPIQIRVAIGEILRSPGAGRFILSNFSSANQSTEELCLDGNFRNGIINTIALFNNAQSIIGASLLERYPYQFIKALKLKFKRLKQRVNEAVGRIFTVFKFQNLSTAEADLLFGPNSFFFVNPNAQGYATLGLRLPEELQDAAHAHSLVAVILLYIFSRVARLFEGELRVLARERIRRCCATGITLALFKDLVKPKFIIYAWAILRARARGVVFKSGLGSNLIHYVHEVSNDFSTQGRWDQADDNTLIIYHSNALPNALGLMAPVVATNDIINQAEDFEIFGPVVV